VNADTDQRPQSPRAVEVKFHSPALAIVALRGEHDLHSWREVTLALAAAGARPGVIVDLSQCSFLDSSMLTTLLVAAKHMRARGGALEVVIPPGAHVRRIFELMNIQAIMAIHDTLDAGIFAAPAPVGDALEDAA
jgi:anti-anti-sigma factor